MIQLQEWNNLNVDLEVSVNIAFHHLQSKAFISSLETLLNRYPELNPNKLQLETLKSSALSDLETINYVIDKCRKQVILITINSLHLTPSQNIPTGH